MQTSGSPDDCRHVLDVLSTRQTPIDFEEGLDRIAARASDETLKIYSRLAAYCTRRG
jgi:hypothetical protein